LIGIWTLLAVVPVWLGGVHQFGAVVVLGLAVLQAHVAYHRDDKAVQQLG
jgi:heme A synthase